MQYIPKDIIKHCTGLCGEKNHSLMSSESSLFEVPVGLEWDAIRWKLSLDLGSKVTFHGVY